MSKEPTTTKRVEQPETTPPDANPWRYRCPNGHTSWTALTQTAEYRCKSCGIRFPEEDLVDLRTEDIET